MNRKIVVPVALLAVAWYLWNPPLAAPLAIELAQRVAPPTGFSAALSIDRAPLQQNLQDRPVIRVDDYELSPIADFQLEALILGRRDYRRDVEARLAPIDLALGWGPMARAEIVDQVSVRQRGRFYSWQVEAYPIARAEIIANSANMHIIPASPDVFAELQRAERDRRIRLRGYLVNVDRDDGWRWRSSTTRSDSGGGACEVILVTLAEVY
ncbi:MAG: hypothetical protein ACOCVP_01355 [Wenzhouxiangella sp.]